MKKKIFLILLITSSWTFGTKLLSQNNPIEKQLISTNILDPSGQATAPRAEPAPGFTLQDLKGNEVSLDDFKGKVVVLDFWATWCAPCIKSFPAMQMAVDKYKDDPEVAFLFINTWEQRDDPTPLVQQFMQKRGFDFTVLVDKKDPVSKENPVVESYGVIGIPAKFIIDVNGDIRHRVIGFKGGDNEEQVQELSSLIESSRK